jgi:hypothetical protein
MVKLSKELSLGVLLVLVVIMVLKPNLLGFLYNNVLGKLVFVAAIVFLSLKHTAAGLLAVVFVAIIATMTGYNGIEGMDGTPDANEEPTTTTTTPTTPTKPKCEGEDCVTEGLDVEAKGVDQINALLKSK